MQSTPLRDGTPDDSLTHTQTPRLAWARGRKCPTPQSLRLQRVSHSAEPKSPTPQSPRLQPRMRAASREELTAGLGAMKGRRSRAKVDEPDPKIFPKFRGPGSRAAEARAGAQAAVAAQAGRRTAPAQQQRASAGARSRARLQRKPPSTSASSASSRKRQSGDRSGRGRAEGRKGLAATRWTRGSFQTLPRARVYISSITCGRRARGSSYRHLAASKKPSRRHAGPQRTEAKRQLDNKKSRSEELCGQSAAQC